MRFKHFYYLHGIQIVLPVVLQVLAIILSKFFLLKTTSVDSMTIPSFTQAFSQAQGDDRGILAQMY